MVEELHSFTAQEVIDIDMLMHELSAASFCNEVTLNIPKHGFRKI